MRTGFLHTAEALELHRDAEVPLRGAIAMLKAGDGCNAEAELIVKGTSGCEGANGACRRSALLTRQRRHQSQRFCRRLVLQGLMEARSPYLEELISLLMTAGAQSGTAGSVATLISLLLQKSEEGAVKKEADSNK